MPYLNTTTLEKLTWHDIRAAHPNTSFPEGAWSDELLESFGYANLHFPELLNDLKPYEEFVEGTPVKENSKWYRTFTKRDIQAETGKEEEFILSEKTKIISKIAAQRYLQETSGVMVDDGDQIKFFMTTDRESQMMITATFTAINNGVLTNVNWKIGSSAWITVDLNTIQLMANTLANHVQKCFNWEKAKVEEVNAITTYQQLLAFARNPKNINLFRD